MMFDNVDISHLLQGPIQTGTLPGFSNSTNWTWQHTYNAYRADDSPHGVTEHNQLHAHIGTHISKQRHLVGPGGPFSL